MSIQAMFPGAPFTRVLVLDYETAWCSKTYTLSKMTTEEYIRDRRFKAWGLCLKDLGSSAPAVWVGKNEAHAYLHEIDWSTTAVLAHNAQFDATILEWRYDVHPVFILDSLSMARALYGTEVGNSLAKLAERFGLPPKGKAVHSTDGILTGNLSPEVEQELADYCQHDTWLCEQIFLRMLPGFPMKELRLVDMTLRMYTQPQLEIDASLLGPAIKEEQEKREGLLARLNVDEKELSSNPKFAKILEGLGVQVPMKKKKPTKKTPNPVGLTYAFAKNDALFQAMLNGTREDIALLCEARLKVKSTLERTRAQRFIDIAARGTLPVPLAYYGAHTGRWAASKGSALNMQNMGRGSVLRDAIMAPDGYVIVVGDLSQIEPRVLAWLADYLDMLTIFRSGADPYAAFGAQMFGIPGLTKESHPLLRQSAKSALLGAGYGLGWASFAAQLLTGFLGAPPVRYDKVMAKQLGVNGMHVTRFLDWKENLRRMEEIPHTCTAEELLVHCLAAKAIIDKYRAAAAPVVALWDLLQQLIQTSLYEGREYTYKGLVFSKEKILLPNGMSLKYDGLKIDKQDEKGRIQWVYGKDNKKVYGGLLAENITQALARIVMTDGMLRTQRRYPVKGTVHDEQIVLAPEEEALEAREWVEQQMSIAPKWMAGVPISAGVGAHKRYGKAKD